MKVYIGVTSKDRYAYLKKCIESIGENTSDVDYSLLVSDDGSTDRRIFRYLANMDIKNLEQVFLRKVPAGITHSVDVMIKYIEFNRWFFGFEQKQIFFCYLQDDTVITTKGWLSTLIKAYRELGDRHKVGFFSGFVAPEHRTMFVDTFDSTPVFIKQSARATNLIATLEHWQSCGLPHRIDLDGKLRGFPGVTHSDRRGSNFDVFLTGGNSRGLDRKFSSKTSNANQGKTVMSMDFIKHRAHSKEESTWNNENVEFKEDIRLLVGVSEGIGNMVQTLPALNLIKTMYPTFGIDILYLDGTKRWFCDHMFRKDSVVKDVYDRSDFPLGKEYYGAYIMASTRAELPKGCICKDISKLKIPRNDHKMWSSNSEVLMNIASVCGISKGKLDMNLEGTDIFNVERFLLPDRFTRSDDNMILFHNGFNKDGKIPDFWKVKSYDGFPEVAAHFKARGYSVACIGSKSEFIPGCIDYTNLPIDQSIAMIANCKVFVSNDTGTYHIAAGLGKPGVTVFTATSRKKNHDVKFHSKMEMVWVDPKCGYHPCQCHADKFWHERCKQHRCRQVPASAVISKIEEVIEKNI